MTEIIHPIPPAPVRPSRIRLPKIFRGKAPAPEPALQDLHFVETGMGRGLRWWLQRQFGLNPALCPVALRGKDPDAVPPLTLVGQAVGFGDEVMQRRLLDHCRQRLRRKRIGGSLLDFLVQPLMVFIWMPAFMHLMVSPAGLGYWMGSAVLGIAISILLFLIGWSMTVVLCGIAARLVLLLVDRRFAEALCVSHALYLLVHLQHQDVLERVDRRRELVIRLDGLARATRLLGLRYGLDDPASRSRLQRHFGEIARYVAERRIWAITPMETTLDDLRRDMRELAGIFITGTYGEFRWTHGAADDEPGGWKRMVRAAGQTLGLLAPLAAAAYLLLNLEGLQTLGGAGNVVLLVVVAWAMLALDNALQMGLVSGVVGLAKSIKELR